MELALFLLEWERTPISVGKSPGLNIHRPRSQPPPRRLRELVVDSANLPRFARGVDAHKSESGWPTRSIAD